MKRQRLPKFVQAKTGRDGKTRYYFRVLSKGEDGKRKEKNISLPPDPNSEAFSRAYWKLRSGQAPIQQPKLETTFAALIESYRKSQRYRKLAPNTRKFYDRFLGIIQEKNGAKDVRLVSRKHIIAIHEKLADTPRMADGMVQVYSLLFNHAIKLEWVTDNPCRLVDLFGKQREYRPWPIWLRAAWEPACKRLNSDTALIAYHLGIGTGQRPGDLCSMQWDHYDGTYIEVVPDKQSEAGPQERLRILCTDALKTFLDGLPRRGRFILAKNLTQPLGYDAVEREIRRVRAAIDGERAASPVPPTTDDKAAGYSMHGLRKNAVDELAEAGASDAEIQAITGHKSVAMVTLYRKGARQKQLAEAGQRRRNTAATPAAVPIPIHEHRKDE